MLIILSKKKKKPDRTLSMYYDLIPITIASTENNKRAKSKQPWPLGRGTVSDFVPPT